MTINGKIKQVLGEYTGREIVSVAVVPDGEVAGVWAVKVVAKDGAPFECLLSEPFSVDNVEEVEFTQWPPTRR